MFLTTMIENSTIRKEYECNFLRPSVDTVLERLRLFESKAGRDYFDTFTRLEFKKGDFLLREGEISTRFWFLEEGLARLFVYKKKKEMTSDFFFPSEFIDVYDSSTLKIPSEVNIQFLSDSVVYAVNWISLDKLKLRYPVLSEIEKVIVACYCRNMLKRIIEFQTLSSTERYMQLIEAHPYMLQQVTITQMASYLGIKVETLSRIRAKLRI